MKFSPHALLLAACAIVFAGPGRAEDLAPGQLLTFTLSEDQPGGEAARTAYLGNAFPMAHAAGMRELSAFKVEQVLLGDGAPQRAGLYLWPAAEAARALRTDPRYVERYRPLRSAAWKRLQTVDVPVAVPMPLAIDRQRPLTLALVWLKDRAEYERYYAGTATLRERLGTRTLLATPASRYEKLGEGEIDPPDMVVLVSWESRGAIDAYVGSPEFAAQHEHFDRGVERLEWYRLGALD